MKASRTMLSTVGLVLLAVLAVGLSVAAFLHVRPTEPITATPSPGTEQATTEPAPGDGESTTRNVPETEDSETPDGGTTPDETATPRGSGGTVVIIGDRYSMGPAEETWVGAATEKLGWEKVVNLSDPGRGFMARPRDCERELCETFQGTIPAIADEDPAIVITFGGTADGDVDIRGAAQQYFAALREELPDAELIAIGPVTTEDNAPYWLTMHKQSIQAAVGAVDGTFVDVGQPGLGDGEDLNEESRSEIADKVIEELG